MPGPFIENPQRHRVPPPVPHAIVEVLAEIPSALPRDSVTQPQEQGARPSRGETSYHATHSRGDERRVGSRGHQVVAEPATVGSQVYGGEHGRQVDGNGPAASWQPSQEGAHVVPVVTKQVVVDRFTRAEKERTLAHVSRAQDVIGGVDASLVAFGGPDAVVESFTGTFPGDLADSDVFVGLREGAIASVSGRFVRTMAEQWHLLNPQQQRELLALRGDVLQQVGFGSVVEELGRDQFRMVQRLAGRAATLVRSGVDEQQIQAGLATLVNRLPTGENGGVLPAALTLLSIVVVGAYLTGHKRQAMSLAGVTFGLMMLTGCGGEAQGANDAGGPSGATAAATEVMVEPTPTPRPTPLPTRTPRPEPTPTLDAIGGPVRLSRVEAADAGRDWDFLTRTVLTLPDGTRGTIVSGDAHGTALPTGDGKTVAFRVEGGSDDWNVALYEVVAPNPQSANDVLTLSDTVATDVLGVSVADVTIQDGKRVALDSQGKVVGLAVTKTDLGTNARDVVWVPADMGEFVIVNGEVVPIPVEGLSDEVQEAITGGTAVYELTDEGAIQMLVDEEAVALVVQNDAGAWEVSQEVVGVKIGEQMYGIRDAGSAEAQLVVRDPATGEWVNPLEGQVNPDLPLPNPEDPDSVNRFVGQVATSEGVAAFLADSGTVFDHITAISVEGGQIPTVVDSEGNRVLVWDQVNQQWVFGSSDDYYGEGKVIYTPAVQVEMLGEAELETKLKNLQPIEPLIHLTDPNSLVTETKMRGMLAVGRVLSRINGQDIVTIDAIYKTADGTQHRVAITFKGRLSIIGSGSPITPAELPFGVGDEFTFNLFYFLPSNAAANDELEVRWNWPRSLQVVRAPFTSGAGNAGITSLEVERIVNQSEQWRVGGLHDLRMEANRVALGRKY